jgi:hypothetical protein
VSLEHTACQDASHGCWTNRVSKSESTKNTHQPTRRVVTLSKQVVDSPGSTDKGSGKKTSRLHHHYARLTIDDQGKVVKLVVSR